MIVSDAVREQFFGTFFVLTDRKKYGRNKPWIFEFFWTLFYLIDAGQVIRTLVSTKYGWSFETATMIGKVDIANLVFNDVCVIFIESVNALCIWYSMIIPSLPVFCSWISDYTTIVIIAFFHKRCSYCCNRDIQNRSGTSISSGFYLYDFVVHWLWCLGFSFCRCKNSIFSRLCYIHITERKSCCSMADYFA